MKKVIIGIIALFCLWVVAANAQGPGGPPPPSGPGGPPPPLTPEMREKVEAMKVAFFTQKLDLTPAEAKVFWPVYDQYQDELFKLRDKNWKTMRDAKNDEDGLTEKDYENKFDSEISFRQAELDIMKKYHPMLKKTLPMSKLAKLQRIDNEFKRELLDKIKDKHDGNGRKDGHPPRK